MAKKFSTTVHTKKSNDPNFPSSFGSHISMLNKELSRQLSDPKKFSVLTDQHGHYVTENRLLDTGISDPNRYASIETRLALLKETGVDPNKKLPPVVNEEIKADGETSIEEIVNEINRESQTQE